MCVVPYNNSNNNNRYCRLHDMNYVHRSHEGEMKQDLFFFKLKLRNNNAFNTVLSCMCSLYSI